MPAKINADGVPVDRVGKPVGTAVGNVWDRVSEDPEFKTLLQEKSRFIVPATIFFMVYYIALLVLVGYAPDLMKTRIFGPVNLAYLFALSQFFMAWIIAWLYMRAANRFDRMANAVIQDIKKPNREGRN